MGPLSNLTAQGMAIPATLAAGVAGGTPMLQEAIAAMLASIGLPPAGGEPAAPESAAAPEVPDATVAAPVVPDALVAAPVVPDATVAAPVVPDATVAAPVVPDALVAVPVVPDPTVVAPVVPEAIVAAPVVPDALVAAPEVPPPTVAAPATQAPGRGHDSGGAGPDARTRCGCGIHGRATGGTAGARARQYRRRHPGRAGAGQHATGAPGDRGAPLSSTDPERCSRPCRGPGSGTDPSGCRHLGRR